MITMNKEEYVMNTSKNERISEEQLAEYWYAFMHSLLNEVTAVYRKREDLEQKDIAVRLGRDPASISRWMSGRQNMTVRTINNIARAMDCRLRVSLDDLETVQPANRNITEPNSATMFGNELVYGKSENQLANTENQLFTVDA